jgi:hypothetical protein
MLQKWIKRDHSIYMWGEGLTQNCCFQLKAANLVAAGLARSTRDIETYREIQGAFGGILTYHEQLDCLYPIFCCGSTKNENAALIALQALNHSNT